MTSVPAIPEIRANRKVSGITTGRRYLKQNTSTAATTPGHTLSAFPVVIPLVSAILIIRASKRYVQSSSFSLQVPNDSLNAILLTFISQGRCIPVPGLIFIRTVSP
jgi:hypothetical protein